MWELSQHQLAPWLGRVTPLEEILHHDLYAHVSFTSVATHIKTIQMTVLPFFVIIPEQSSVRTLSEMVVFARFISPGLFYPSICQVLMCLRKELHLLIVSKELRSKPHPSQRAEADNLRQDIITRLYTGNKKYVPLHVLQPESI